MSCQHGAFAGRRLLCERQEEMKPERKGEWESTQGNVTSPGAMSQGRDVVSLQSGIEPMMDAGESH